MILISHPARSASQLHLMLQNFTCTEEHHYLPPIKHRSVLTYFPPANLVYTVVGTVFTHQLNGHPSKCESGCNPLTLHIHLFQTSPPSQDGQEHFISSLKPSQHVLLKQEKREWRRVEGTYSVRGNWCSVLWLYASSYVS